MPLINCPDCAKECSTNAAACPHCGRPIVAFTPIQREVAKNVAGMTSGCFWFIIGILLLVLSPILVPLLVVAIVLPYEWMQSNPVLAGFLILATLIVFGVYLRKRRISK